jgi:hypothetical protein
MYLRSDSTQFNKTEHSFHDIFKQAQNNKSNSRPPKIELTGILIPFFAKVNGHNCKFKLETDSKEYFLSLSESLFAIAKKIDWEEVIVKGLLDPETDTFEVEKISLAHEREPYRVGSGPVDLLFELDHYRRAILRQGKLDLSPDFLAS